MSPSSPEQISNVPPVIVILPKGKDVELHNPGPDSISTINYTSDTTGTPKCVKVSHNSIILNTDVIEMLGLYLHVAHRSISWVISSKSGASKVLGLNLFSFYNDSVKLH